MPERETLERAKRDAREGKSPSTQAGEFVREEMHHVREGKHGVRSSKQAIAIGLSKARRAGVELSPPDETHSDDQREQATRDLEAGHEPGGHKPSPRRSRAVSKPLEREGHSGASHKALSKQAKQSASSRTAKSRSQQGKRAAATRRRGKSAGAARRRSSR